MIKIVNSSWFYNCCHYLNDRLNDHKNGAIFWRGISSIILLGGFMMQTDVSLQTINEFNIKQKDASIPKPDSEEFNENNSKAYELIIVSPRKGAEEETIASPSETEPESPIRKQCHATNGFELTNYPCFKKRASVIFQPFSSCYQTEIAVEMMREYCSKL